MIDHLLTRTHDEINRQDERWGEQNHPLIGGLPGNNPATFEWREHLWKQTNDRRVKYGSLGWDGILLEEVYEALAAKDRDHQIEELIQVAAVALQAAASLERAA